MKDLPNIEGLEDYLTDDELTKLAPMLERLSTLDNRQKKHDNFLNFVKTVWPQFIQGSHHKIYAQKLQDVADGKIKRLIINMPPRHTKSEFASYLFPAWLMGRDPSKKIIQATHTAELAVGFGRKVKNLIDSEDFRDVFPNVKLATDAKASGRWSTSGGGEYYAVGVGGALAGRGADLLLVDDPHSEQDVINGNFSVFEKAYEWFTFGARTRLMPGGRVAIIQTRWHMDDLTGRVINDMTKNSLSDQYEIVEFPAILDVVDKETNEPVQKPLWPEFFDLEALLRTKASMPVFQWNAQYQQEPTAEEAALVKREWWNMWKEDSPPPCEYIIMSLDAAAETHNRADYTALTTWGVFLNESDGNYNIILLNSIKKRMEFPELKEMAMSEYSMWEPDSFIVEKKNSGTALYQEMRRMGLPIQEYTPHRGSGDKLARLNSVSDIVSSGLVWVPETRWAEEVIEEVAGFPFMSHDDLVDSTVMALMRFRQGGFIRLPSDEPEETHYFRRKSAYY